MLCVEQTKTLQTRLADDYDDHSSGGQFNSFVEISTNFSTGFSTEFLVLQGVPHYYKNSVEKSVEKSVEISTKLLNCAPAVLVGHVLSQVTLRGEQDAALSALYLFGRRRRYFAPLDQ